MLPDVIPRILNSQFAGQKPMKMPKTDIPNVQNDRKKRLADALRQNLLLRKARARAGDPEAIKPQSASIEQKNEET